MDKNKSRTDMLAAGRKKLQQYRKKKDGKGSKSLGKAGISEQAVDDDTTPAAVKPAEVKPLVPEGERSAHDLMGEPVNLSVLHSRENSVASDIDPVTSDSSSVPVSAETDIAQTALPTAVEFPSEVAGVDEVGLSSSVGNEQDFDSSVQNNAGSSCAGDTDAANESSSEKWEMVDSEGKFPHVSEPSRFDLSAPPDFVYDSAAVEDAIEVERAHGADQVPDIGAMQEAEPSDSKQIDRSSMMESEGDRGLAISGLDESAETDMSAASVGMDMDGTFFEAEHTSKPHDVSLLEGETTEIEEVQKADWQSDSTKSKPHYVSASVGSSSEVKEVWKADDHSDSANSLPLPDGGSVVSAGQFREDVGSSIGEKSETPIMSSDSGNYHAGAVQEYTLDKLDDNKGPFVSENNSFASSLASKMIPGVDGSLVRLSQLAGVVQGLDEDEFRFLLLTRESTTKNAGGLSVRAISDALETLTEQLYLTNVAKDMFHLQLTEQLEIQTEFDQQRRQSEEAQVVFPKMPNMDQESLRDDDSNKVPGKGGNLNLFPVLERSLSVGQAESSPLNQLKLDVYDDSLGFVALREHLEQAGKVFQKLEKAIEEMHSHSASLSRSSSKVVAPAVSKLIQAFESKNHADDSDGEGVLVTENQSHADPYMLTKEQTVNLRTLLQELSVDAENASELFKGERHGKILSDFTVKELKVQHDALQEESYNLEETKIELVVLYELIRQHVCNVEAKKGELLLLYEALRQQDVIVKVENTELGNKLSAYKSRISDLQGQLDELHQNSNEMISSINTRMEILHKEVSDRAFKLDEEWNSTISWLANAVEKLDAHIGSVPSSHWTGTQNDLDIGSRVAATFEAASRAIDDLQDKLGAVHTDHELICSSYKVLNEKFNDMHGQNELATGLLHKIYASLRELVNDSSGYAEGSEADIQIEKLLDPLHTNTFDTLMEQLRKLLDERMLLKSVNNQLNSDLINKTNNIEEMNRRCLGADAILKLVQHVEGVVNLEDLEINMDEPASFLESLTYFLLQRYKEVNDMAISSRDELGSREKKLNELQAQVDHFILLLVHCETENIIFKGSLKSTMEDLVAVRSYILGKATELEQSEQKVSSLREKLSIAVAKGKGLIVQRDGLKQSLAEKFGELERCLQELQLKDARLLEVETKLKPYSEAGERVEALESELSYIRNSATALRESFLLKDSVLQRIEEILEDLELPEHFHARDIIEKIDWLARSVTGNSMPPTDWDQKSSVGGGSYMDAWKEDLPQHSNTEDELRRKYEDLQGKFYGLAEQNEMLEQSLMERNNLVQRWEEILDKINMPSQLRSMEPEDRIEWLGGALSEAVHRCESLQQKIENIETFCGSLSADLEESQRRIADLEAALRTITSEKEHLSASMEILTRDNDEVSEKADLFEVQNDKLQSEATELQEKLELMCGLEERIHHITSEKEQLCASLEILTLDNHRVLEKADLFEVQNDKLKNELTLLQEKLEVMCGLEERIHHVNADIRRLQDLLSDVLQDSNEEQDSGTTGIECLEQLLRKLMEKYSNLSTGGVVPAVTVEHITEKASAILGEKIITDSVDAEEQELAVLKKELEEARESFTRVKEERDGYMEKNQSLVHEVEKLDIKRLELQELLSQEEQKSASVREKLNLAVRKGKSLVQQRDSMRQTIDQITTEVERLKSELNIRENALSGAEQKIKDLFVYQDMIEGMESKSLILQNRLAESERDLQDKRHTLSMICDALGEIDVGIEYNVMDPVEKIVQIAKLWHGLHAATASSEHESNKSRRAAELLLAELNEVQERNDGFQEELAKAAAELLELAKERDTAEAAKHDALSHVENLTAVLSEERNNQVAAFTALKSYVHQLRKGFFNFKNLLGDALSKDLEVVHNFEATIKSFLKSADAADMVSLGLGGAPTGIVSTNSENEEEFLSLNSFSESQEQFNNNSLSEICNFVGHHLLEVTKEIGALKEKLYKHSSSLHEEANSLSEIVGTIHTEMSSRNQFYESMKGDIFRLESIEKEKDMEIMVLHRNISLLYEACKSSIMEIKNWKAQLVGKGLTLRDQGFNMESLTSVKGGNIFIGQTVSASEGFVSTMADGLLSAVKEIVSVQNEIGEVGQMELKTTISNLQTQLQEKDIEKDRICLELVNQIKEAESKAMRYLQELQSSKDQMHDLEKWKGLMEEEHNRLQLKVEELQNREATSIDMQESIRSLTDVIAAKDQEIEDLMQALDEEEGQMEDLKNKIKELEIFLQQKSLDLENAEASRGKVSKKLSITVSKFDQLHHLSESLLTEVEKLQSQLHDRDSEISFLRQEVTRCTNDALVASQMSKDRKSDEIYDLVSWLDSMISQVQVHDVHSDDKKRNQDHEYKKEILKNQIMSIISELEDLRAGMQGRDNLLRLERSRVEELMRKGESLEKDLQEKESQLTILQRVENSGQETSMTSEIMEIEPVTNKWVVPGPSITPQVRSLRKSNNDQVAISVDMDPGSGRELEEEDDDKAHGFKSLTASKVVPRFTRPVTDLIDGLWVSCDRALMRQPALRLGVIMYWFMLHALLATFAV